MCPFMAFSVNDLVLNLLNPPTIKALLNSYNLYGQIVSSGLHEPTDCIRLIIFCGGMLPVQ